jgi:catalase
MNRKSNTLLAVLVGSLFASMAGTVSAQAPTPDHLVDALEGVFGKQAGFRRSGAKGICATGFFVGTAEGRGLSTAAVFKGAEVPVIARFSVGGGNPKAPDKSKSVRGLAVKFNGPGKETWEMANISAPVFFVNSPANFVKFFEARRPVPGTAGPDPAKVKAFNDSHPDAKPQIEYLAKAPVPASYAAVNYWGTNAFEFTDPAGKKALGKWVFEPARGVEGLTDDQLKALPAEFLNDDLKTRVAKGGVAFNFNVQIAAAGDVVNDATVPLPANRKVVNAGRLVIEKVDESGASCDKITFNPLVLPKGIGPSADPVLLARPGSYAVSLGRRLQK